MTIATRHSPLATKSGFTLVELSIVIVIIGLLIGGILVGQSLIESAKISKVIKDISSIKILMAQYKLKYKCLPGDCLSIGSNNDGLLQYQRDSARVKWQLRDAGMVSSTYDFATNCNVSNHANTPMGCNFTGSFSGSVMTFNSIPGCTTGSAVGCDMGYGPAVSGFSMQANDNYILYGSDSFIKQTNLGADNVYRKPHVLFKPQEAMAIDQKVDDSLPNTGEVLGWITYPEYMGSGTTVGGVTGYTARCNVNFGNYAPTEQYQVSFNAIGCGLAFLLTRSGDVVHR